MRRRNLQLTTSVQPPIRDGSKNNAIFHVRTHHDRELSRLSKRAKEATRFPAAQTLPNMGMSQNNRDAFGSRRVARRNLSVGSRNPAQSSLALVPAIRPPNRAEGRTNVDRIKLQGGDGTLNRPSKIVASLSNRAPVCRPERTVRMATNPFQTPTIREIGSKEDLCQLPLNDQGNTPTAYTPFPDLWNEGVWKNGHQTPGQPNSYGSVWQNRSAPKHQLSEQPPVQDVWKDHIPAAYWQGQTQIPHGLGWVNTAGGSQTLHNPWQASINQIQHDDHTHYQRPVEFKDREQAQETPVRKRPSNNIHRNSYPDHTSNQTHHQSRSCHRRMKTPEGTEYDYESKRKHHESHPTIPELEQTENRRVFRPESEHDDTPNTYKSDDPHALSDMSCSNVYGSRDISPDYDDGDVRKDRRHRNSSRRARDHRTSSRTKKNRQRHSSNNNHVPTFPLCPLGPRQMCETCSYVPCSTCRCPVCVVCTSLPCSGCSTPVCQACSSTSRALYSFPVCITCCQTLPLPPRPRPPPCPPTQYPCPPVYPMCDPYAAFPDHLSPCSPYIDWAARCNLPPLIPNYVNRTNPQNAPLKSPPTSKYFETIKEGSQRNLARAFPSYQCHPPRAPDKANNMCPQRLPFCCCFQNTPCDQQQRIRNAEDLEDPFSSRSFIDIIILVVPIIIFYVLLFFSLSSLIGINKFTRLAAVMANVTLLYIILLEPDDLIIYPTDKPQITPASSSCCAM